MIDAAVMRMMKAQKSMAHSSIVSEVMLQLTEIKPKSSIVERRIESFVERNYVERSSEDRSAYNYLP
jgi:cullin 3